MIKVITQLINCVSACLIGLLLGYILSNDSIRKDCEHNGKAKVLKDTTIQCKVINDKYSILSFKHSDN